MVEQLERGEQRQAQFTKKLGQTKALYDELKYTCAEQTEQNAVLLQRETANRELINTQREIIEDKRERENELAGELKKRDREVAGLIKKINNLQGRQEAKEREQIHQREEYEALVKKNN